MNIHITECRTMQYDALKSHSRRLTTSLNMDEDTLCSHRTNLVIKYKISKDKVIMRRKGGKAGIYNS